MSPGGLYTLAQLSHLSIQNFETIVEGFAFSAVHEVTAVIFQRLPNLLRLLGLSQSNLLLLMLVA